MFNAPPVDPLSAGLPERLGVSGAEYLLQQLEMKRVVPLKAVQLVVPQTMFSESLANEMELALRRYAECRITHQQMLMRDNRRHGWRLTGSAIVLLAFCLALSNLFASSWTEGLRPLIRKTFEYGFEIVGWVMLWYPIEVLVFQPIAIRNRIAALQRLLELIVVVEVAADAGRTVKTMV